nr:putative ovoperoxidase [uncultured bacterium]
MSPNPHRSAERDPDSDTDPAGVAQHTSGVSRRHVLGGIGAAASSPLFVGEQPATASPHALSTELANPNWRHSGNLRGLVAAAGKEKEGRFGVMFKKLEAYRPPDELLRKLAAQLTEPTDLDLNNPRIPAGFTFLGQFIDHDMTLDRSPLSDQTKDPDGLTNFQSPLFDLSSMYGIGGPDKNPDLYEPDGSGRLRVTRNVNGVDDLPRRADGVALIGDGRNDENLIVSQLHLLFIKFHNRCLTTGLASSFAEAQRLTRWHFQWIIVNDYLAHVAGSEVVKLFLNGTTFEGQFYKPKNPFRPMMPIEYSVAAFRFGHSMVRGGYPMNSRSDGFALIFGAEGSDLRGSRPLPARFEIEWPRFFSMPGQSVPLTPSRIIDARLSQPMFRLPPTVVNDGVVSLALRNLTRGRDLSLPAGQDVARAMGIPPISNTELGIPDPGWAGKAPLWFYILKEAELQQQGRRLGQVGGRLVTEVILGILDADKTSYLTAKRNPFRPVPPIAPSAGQFTMGDFVKFARGL